jgi:hypothetical protein
MENQFEFPLFLLTFVVATTIIAILQIELLAYLGLIISVLMIVMAPLSSRVLIEKAAISITGFAMFVICLRIVL